MSDIRERIVSLYGPKVLRKSALNIRGGAGVFEKVMAGQGIGTALEIGTYRGVAAAEMSQYCGFVITIDLEHGKLEASGEEWDRRLFWHSLGIENIALMLVKDDDHKRLVIEQMAFDFAFIDGAHDRTVANDFALVKRCGRVLFHDYDRRGGPDEDHVCDFVDSLPKHHVQVHDIFALWTA